jgi:hypothetical protein
MTPKADVHWKSEGQFQGNGLAGLASNKAGADTKKLDPCRTPVPPFVLRASPRKQSS